jgi:hypothetical protein
MGQGCPSHELPAGAVRARVRSPAASETEPHPEKRGPRLSVAPTFTFSVKHRARAQRPGAVPRASPLPRASRFSFATSQNELAVIRMITGRTKWG